MQITFFSKPDPSHSQARAPFAGLSLQDRLCLAVCKGQRAEEKHFTAH
jgi:hypothetical protein